MQAHSLDEGAIEWKKDFAIASERAMKKDEMECQRRNEKEEKMMLK